MPLDATGASLPELFRSLNIAPDYKHALVALAEQVERNAAQLAHEHMIEQAARAPAPLRAPTGPRHKRDRHLRLIPGGLAAFAPIAFLLHGAPAALAFAGVRAWLKSELGRWIAAAALFGLAGATVGGTVAAVDVQGSGAPHPHAIIHAHAHHRRRWQQQNPPPVMPVVPVPAARKATMHRHHVDNDATPTPTGPDPAPSASATGSPTPAPTLTPTPTATPTMPGNGGLISRGTPPWQL